MKTLLLAAVLMLTGCTSDTSVLNEPPVQPIAVQQVALQIPEVQGVALATQEWLHVGRSPQPVILMEYTVQWEGNAEGYDVLINREYITSIITPNQYVIRQQHAGELRDINVASLLPVVQIRAWEGAGQEVISQPVDWVY